MSSVTIWFCCLPCIYTSESFNLRTTLLFGPCLIGLPKPNTGTFYRTSRESTRKQDQHAGQTSKGQAHLEAEVALEDVQKVLCI